MTRKTDPIEKIPQSCLQSCTMLELGRKLFATLEQLFAKCGPRFPTTLTVNDDVSGKAVANLLYLYAPYLHSDVST
jgi:hypothetical protein